MATFADIFKEACEAGVAESMTAAEIEAELDREIWDLNYPTLIPI